ncbi:hypothetical protein THAOC_22343 [Thalassiosira oceanica]|uniref:Sulfatase N-terminal domain-containing protein n=1 Tax=Thalassiosira oceanica TaxID=159749 RepID=K0SG90_THAOC|nr:hypothetical protein THAOC_22343 [Thalassiosira oceanica]|eukprot:EJK57597.1 hypothetical protein THAOC_22343 [Thalassiosira oceanica]
MKLSFAFHIAAVAARATAAAAFGDPIDISSAEVRRPREGWVPPPPALLLILATDDVSEAIMRSNKVSASDEQGSDVRVPELFSD